jgi:hypothetical protein
MEVRKSESLGDGDVIPEVGATTKASHDFSCAVKGWSR